jgi:potassium efflux system protein
MLQTVINATPQTQLPTRPGIAIIASILLWSASVHAADSPVPTVPSGGTVSVEQLETAINAVSAREGLAEETRSAVIDQLRDAQSQLQNRIAAEAATAAFSEALETAPPATMALRRQLDEPTRSVQTAADLGIQSNTPMEEVEGMLSRELAEVASAEARLSELDGQMATLEERPAAARQRINELRTTREQVASQVDAAPPPGEAPILTDARKLAAELRLDARTAELSRLEQELASHGVRLALVRAQRDAAARNFVRLQQEVQVLQDVANERRQSAAEQALQEAALAELAAADSHPVVRALAEGNAELTRELPLIVADMERVTRDLGQVENQVRQIEQAYARSTERLEIAGVSQVIGRLFVEERRNLPQVSQYRAEVRARRKTLAQIGLAQVRIKEQRRGLTPIDVSIESTMAEVDDSATTEEDLQVIREQVESLLRNRRDLLNQVESTYTSYLRALGDLDVAQKSLLGAAAEYKEFLDRHLLWIPSADFFGPKSIGDLGSALAWVLSPSAWSEALASLLDAAREDIGITLVLLALLLFVALSRRPLAARFKGINARIGDPSSDHIGLTFAALGIAILRAAPLPLAFMIASFLLGRGIAPSEFTSSLSYALTVVAPFLYNALLFRVLCASEGVLQLHFGWGAGRLPDIRRQLDRLIAIGVPLIFAAALTYNSPISGHRESLGRLLFIAMMILFSGVAHPLLHPVRGVAAKFYSTNPGGWMSRLRWFWYGLVAGVPLLLAAISIVGYLYTAAMLTGQLIDTSWLLLVIGIVSLVIRRWLALTRQRIAGELESEQQNLDQALPDESGSEGELPVVERKPLDLDAIDQQTRRLVNAVLVFIGVLIGWGIWADILPALGVLEQVSLWTQAATIDGQQTVVPVTLADLLLALVIAAVTTIAAKNLPGLMEIMVLQRMTLQPGSRYAINTLVRYVVVTVGVIAVLNIVGWDWSQIQWLVAALSVGLGFGLQEIVANFVSGLVILFERPVRVGDTVTVGQLTGKVSRVRIRATTITDWDRKEIIVPNKAFITEQVINWTLSDPITRIVIPVGIAYGSDFNLAHQVMQKTLRALPLVLDEPEPKVYFVGFGDSSLNFNLYVFSRELDDRLPLTHAVHAEILAALRENGIEIPFPQRDLHVRSVSPDIKVFGADGDDD